MIIFPSQLLRSLTADHLSSRDFFICLRKSHHLSLALAHLHLIPWIHVQIETHSHNINDHPGITPTQVDWRGSLAQRTEQSGQP